MIPHHDPYGEGPRRRPTGRLAPALTLLFILLFTTTGCGDPRAKEEVDRTEIQEVLEAYLPLLGRAYAEQNARLIESYAVPKEIARINLRIDELEVKGQIYEPEFKTVTVEDVSVWNYSNAFVTTSEVWDVQAFTVGSRLLVNQSLDQRSRVKYQLKRKDDGWVVLYRELEKTSDS
ncbi:MAG: IMS domain-containing protein [Acidobacteriota bacterium]